MTNSTHSDLFADADIIYAYTRKQALADGVQYALTERQQKIAQEAGWRLPIFLTVGLFNVIDKSVKFRSAGGNSDGVMWDVFFMGAQAARRNKKESQFVFPVSIDGKLYILRSECGPMDIDDPSAVITMSLASED